MDPPFPLAGEAAALTAAFLWAIGLCIFRGVGAHLPPATLTLGKNVIALSCLAILLSITPRPWPTDAETWGALMMSGFVGLAVGDLFLFAGLAAVGTRPAAVLMCLAPPLTVLIAAVTIDETLSGRELVGMFVTVGAVVGVILADGKNDAATAALPSGKWRVGIACGLVAALCQAVGIVLSRRALQDTDAIVGTTLRLLPAVAALAIAPIIPRIPRHRFSPLRRGRVAALLFTASFVGTFLGVALLSFGTKYAPAGIAAALSSTTPIWVIPIARVTLGDRATWQSAALTVLAVVGVAVMMSARM